VIMGISNLRPFAFQVVVKQKRSVKFTRVAIYMMNMTIVPAAQT